MAFCRSWSDILVIRKRVAETHLLLTHGADYSDQKIFSFFEASLDFFSDVALRNLNIIFGISIVVHQVKETVIDVDLYTE